MTFRSLTAGLLFAGFVAVAFAGPAYTDPQKTDADFPFQGEYTGVIKTPDGDMKVGLQVIAKGKGKFAGTGYGGGLPGDGWDRVTKKAVEGSVADGVLKFATDEGEGVIKDGEVKITLKSGEAIGTLKKVDRESPTLSQKAPDGAVVLFDGTTADAFQGGKISEDGLLIQGCTSKQKFGSCKLHLEFRTPYQPEDSGQGRGNSGLYLQGRYEVQVLDSFGLKGKNNECGGLYSVAADQPEHVLPAAVVADVRHRLHRRGVRRRQDRQESPRHGQAQRRGDSRRRRTARQSQHDRGAGRGRQRAGPDVSAGPRQPGALSEYLGGGEEVVSREN